MFLNFFYSFITVGFATFFTPSFFQQPTLISFLLLVSVMILQANISHLADGNEKKKIIQMFFIFFDL